MSMTIEKAIKHFTQQVTDKSVLSVAMGMDSPRVLSAVELIYEANALALAALREKAERENPAPLTFDELWHMHGEPVYVTVPGKPHRSKWCIVEICSPRPGLHGIEYFCDLAVASTPAVKVYRHKPKEDAE